MIPGPTPVPEKVLQALSKHPIGHRSKEFQDLVESTTKNLQWLHQTKNDVLTIDLDLINYTLRYSINDNDFGIAFDNIKPNTSYRLAVTLGANGKGTQIQLL